MTARVRLPRMLVEAVGTPSSLQVDGVTVDEALGDLFRQAAGLRTHLVDESGSIRRHVSVFVDGQQADLDTTVGEDADIRILHAVSGG